MKTFQHLFFVLLAVGFLAFAGTPAFAQNEFCDSLTGNPGAGECVVNTSHSLGTGIKNFTVDRTLRITTNGELKVTPLSVLTLTIAGGTPTGLIIENGGKITGDTASGTITAATININVESGDIILDDSGAFITADNTKGLGCGTGSAGTVNVSATGLNAKIKIENGAIVSASGLSADKQSLGTCSAGAINITSSNKGAIEIDGSVLSESVRSGGGSATTQQPGGGPIFITASCNLTITENGRVSSKGQDPGADLVHLEGGCEVLIKGLVQSTGVGHATPRQPSTSCSDLATLGGTVRRNPAIRPGKPANSVACVEVWAGNNLTILRDVTDHEGEINADTGGSGGSSGTSWIDLFARGNINILSTATAAAVHADGIAGTNDNGGVVTVKSRDGKVILNGIALQANATNSGGSGGNVVVEATLDVDLRAVDASHVNGIVKAMGATSGGAPHGGTIKINSQANIEAGTSSNLNVTGKSSPDGKVELTACNTIAFAPGTISPLALPPANIVKLPNTCPPSVTFTALYIIDLPDCACDEKPPGDPVCEKGPVKAVLNQVTGRFPGNLGPDVTVRLDLKQSVQNAIDTAGDSNGDGYIIVSVLKDGTGELGGSTSESIVINREYEKRFALIACSVTLKDSNKDDSQPTALIAGTASSPAGSAENIFVMDLHGSGSEMAGWKVEGNGRYLRNVATNKNAIGVWFKGNGNIMHNGNAVDNTGVGLLIEGNNNLVDSTDSYSNGGHGIQVKGNSNTIKKTDIGDRGKGNGGDGLNVNGLSNILSENDLYANSGSGLFLTGNNNQVLKNRAGDRSKENGLDGLSVSGSGNTVKENDAFSNLGNGIKVVGGVNTLSKNTAGDRGDKANAKAGFYLGGGGSLTENTAIGNLGHGFHLTTNGFTLKSNVSGGSGSGQPNVGCQYNFGGANTNSGSNKSNNVTLAGAFLAGTCR